MEGGFDAFRKWIGDNNKLMNISDTLDFSGFVVVRFYNDTSGQLSDIKILGINYDQKAYNLVKG